MINAHWYDVSSTLTYFKNSGFRMSDLIIGKKIWHGYNKCLKNSNFSLNKK